MAKTGSIYDRQISPRKAMAQGMGGFGDFGVGTYPAATKSTSGKSGQGTLDDGFRGTQMDAPKVDKWRRGSMA